MAHDFDRLLGRPGTGGHKRGEDGPGRRTAHGISGSGPTLEQVTELHELVAARLARLHGWRVAPETVVLLPGVIPGFNVACRMLAAPGDGLLLQLPLYPPT